ncbi:unnamed protein product [Rotaria magnacalcarata]|uniref:DUF1254 domain-containing protein n=1 Tax=Rotaria magnacalcarata TaxID=392030 RepID=A0A819ZMP6_9BILA|nr:unnamed protein product [Rotaria magnacalcarata]
MQTRYLVLIILIVLSSLCGAKHSYVRLEPHEARRIAIEAYIYGYSLVTSEVTRIQMTNSTGQGVVNTPMGVFNNLRSYPPATYHGVVAPNADTLYSIAWVDLDSEPWIFSHPDMNDRFYLFPIYTLWTPVLDDPGTRTTGTPSATYALVGPKWKIPLPEKVQEKITKIIYSPTRYIVILGRTYCTGTQEDYQIVHRLQDQYLLRPLGSFIRNENETYSRSDMPAINGNPDPPFNRTGSVRDVIKNMNISTYFNIMATRMQVSSSSGKDVKYDGSIIDKRYSQALCV